MTNLLIIALLIVFAIVAGKVIVEILAGLLRTFDRTPNYIIIPLCLATPFGFMGLMLLAQWAHH